MDNKKSGRILLWVCLFFAAGVFLGCKTGSLAKSSGEFGVFAEKLRMGYSADVGKTFLKELKYVIFLWVTGFFLKNEPLQLQCVMLKGFFLGWGAQIVLAAGGLTAFFAYMLPLQVFSCIALIMTGAYHIYNSERNMKTDSVFVSTLQSVFLVFLGVAVEFIILKII